MQSRIEELLQAIIDGKSASELQPAQSRMEQQFIDIITGGHLSGTPQSRAEALLAQIQSGGGGEAVLIEKYVNSNGDYIAKDDNADGYSKVNVEVPNSYTILDEGKVVNGGQLVEQTARAETITQNGSYGTTLNSSVVVDIPEPSGTIEINENGTVDVTDYASAAVQVAGGSDIDLSYLPNSTAADVITSQDASMLDTTHGNKWGQVITTVWGDSYQNENLYIIDGGIRKENYVYMIRDVGALNLSMTVYICVKLVRSASNYPTIIAVRYADNNKNQPNFHQRGMDIWMSVYNDDTYLCSGADYVVLAMSLDQISKTVTFYKNGEKSGTKQFYNSGRAVGIGCSHIASSSVNALDIKYFGIVVTCESDETIIANMQTIMEKLNIEP